MASGERDLRRVESGSTGCIPDKDPGGQSEMCRRTKICAGDMPYDMFAAGSLIS